MRPTDEERRRLANNMRTFDVVGGADGRYWLNGTLFGMDVSARSEECIRDGMAHLAFFVETGDVVTGEACELEGACEGRPLPPMVDRDALLALAADVERLAGEQEASFFHVVQVHESTLSTIAARIREACGEAAS